MHMFNDKKEYIIQKKRIKTYMIFIIMGMIVGLIAFILKNEIKILLLALGLFILNMFFYYENEYSLKKEHKKEILFSIIGAILVLIGSLILKDIICIGLGIIIIIYDVVKLLRKQPDKEINE